MNSKKTILLPKYQKMIEQIGRDIKLAIKLRKLNTQQVAERAGIHRATLYRIKKIGDSAVSVGLYFNDLESLIFKMTF